MILDIYEKYTRVRLDLIRMPKYVQYIERFNGIGYFEIIVPYNEPSLPYLVEGNYIHFEDNVCGIIKYRYKETNESTQITIKGYSVKKILTYRSTLLTSTYKGPRGWIAREMVYDFFINPTDSRRKIACISRSNYYPTEPNFVYQNTGGDIEYCIEELLNQIDCGYELNPIISEYETDLTNISTFEFNIKEPSHRTIGNDEDNSPVVFSFENNNLTSMVYVEDSTLSCSTAIVAGEGQGVSRTIVETGDLTSEDIDRIELYVDARDLQKTEVSGQQMTQEEYEQLLTERGNEKLLEHAEFISFDANVISDGNTAYKYGVDYNLGDYVTIIDKEINLQVDLQITEIMKTLTENGDEKLDLKFGEERMTIQQLISKEVIK